MSYKTPEFLEKCDFCQKTKHLKEVESCEILEETVGYVCYDCRDYVLYQSNMKRLEFFKSLLCVPAAFLAKSDSPDKDELPVKLLKCQTKHGRPIAIFWMRGVEKPMVWYWVYPHGNQTYQLHEAWRDNERFEGGPPGDCGWVFYEGDLSDLEYDRATKYVSDLFPNTRIIEITAYKYWQWKVVKKNRE